MKSLLAFILLGLALLAGTGTDLAVAQVTVSLPQNLVGVAGQPIQIPITVSNLAGLGVVSYQFTVSYNPAVLNITGVTTTGTVSASMPGPGPNTSIAGQVTKAGATFLPITGSGMFAILTGTVVGAGTSPLTFTDFEFNEGSPAVTETNGSLTVAGGNHRPVFNSVAAQTVKDGDTLKVTLVAIDPDNDPLTYGFVSVAPTPSILPSVSGNLLKWAPAFVDVGQTYAIRVNVTDNITNRGGDSPGVDSLTVNVTVNRSRVRGDVDGNGLIQAADASDVLKHVAKLVILTNPAALWAADASRDGTISAYDASLILQAAAGLNTIPNLSVQKK